MQSGDDKAPTAVFRYELRHRRICCSKVSYDGPGYAEKLKRHVGFCRKYIQGQFQARGENVRIKYAVGAIDGATEQRYGNGTDVGYFLGRQGNQDGIEVVLR